MREIVDPVAPRLEEVRPSPKPRAPTSCDGSRAWIYGRMVRHELPL